MSTKTSPRPPHPPRWAELVPTPEVSSGQVGDDALVTGLEVAELALDWHTCEFVEFGESRVAGGTMADSQWYRPSLYDLAFTGVDLANVRQTEAGWRRVSWSDCRMVGLDVASGVLSDVTFTGCLLDLASFRFTKLTRVKFEGCRLRGADLSGATLTDVQFTDCDLSQAQVHQMQTTRGQLAACQLAGLKSPSGLRGMRVSPLDLLELAGLLATDAGIVLDLG